MDLDTGEMLPINAILNILPLSTSFFYYLLFYHLPPALRHALFTLSQYAYRSLRPREKAIVMLWSHVTSHVMNLTWSGQFQIITNPASRGWLSHQLPDYLIFRINLPTFGSNFWINLSNQPFESTYAINLLIELAAPLACDTSLFLTNVRT